jgi:hypothetical protein
MFSVSQIRSLAAIVVAAVVTAFSVVVIRASEVDDTCSYWSDQYHDTTNNIWAGCHSTGYWQWSANWDFTGMNDPDTELATSDDFCNDFVNSCWDDCDSEDYRYWALYTYYNDAYGGCQYSVGCIEGIGNASCPDAYSGSGSCSCMAFNNCPPC